MTPYDHSTTHLSFEVHGDYLRAKVLGEFPSETEVFESIRDEALRVELSRIMIDLLEVQGPVSNLERFWAGKTVADIFGHRFKIAALAQRDKINKAGENAAVNRTARLLVTPDEAEALRWLKG